MEIRKGDVISYDNLATGKVGYAVVVSGNELNNSSKGVMAVMITKYEEEEKATHANVIVKTPSIALCEKVINVGKSRIIDIIRTCNDAEVRDIENALMVALDIGFGYRQDETLDEIPTMPAPSKHELELEAALRDANDKINDLRNRIGYHEQEVEKERKRTKKYKSLYEFAVKKLMEDE